MLLLKFVLLLYGVISSEALDKRHAQCTVDGDRCSLPFDHNGIQRTICVITNGIPWCPTRTKPDGTYEKSLCNFCEGPIMCYIRADALSLQTWKIDCPGECSNISKRLWSSVEDDEESQYSVDSFVCAAAIREGLINRATGGTVKIKKVGQKLKNVIDDNAKLWHMQEEKRAPVFSFEDPGKQEALPRLLFADIEEVYVMNKGNVDVLVRNQRAIESIAFDFASNIVYWSDILEQKIFRGNLSASTNEGQVQELSPLQVKTAIALTYDWVHDLLFWVEDGVHTVSVSTDSGKYQKKLFASNLGFVPKDIAVDPKRGFLYVADCGAKGKIEKCHMTGEDSCVTIVGSKITSPVAIAIDIENDMIYWMDESRGTLSVATSDGYYRRVLVGSEEVVGNPYSMVVYGSRLYFTDLMKGIVSLDKETGEDVHLHFMDLQISTGIAVYDPSVQPKYRSHCKNVPCKFLCLPTSLGYRCACPDGYEPLSIDESNCKLKPEVVKDKNVLKPFIADNEYSYNAGDEFNRGKKKPNKGRSVYQDL